jgi:hypothetical protein
MNVARMMAAMMYGRREMDASADMAFLAGFDMEA